MMRGMRRALLALLSVLLVAGCGSDAPKLATEAEYQAAVEEEGKTAVAPNYETASDACNGIRSQNLLEEEAVDWLIRQGYVEKTESPDGSGMSIALACPDQRRVINLAVSEATSRARDERFAMERAHRQSAAKCREAVTAKLGAAVFSGESSKLMGGELWEAAGIATIDGVQHKFRCLVEVAGDKVQVTGDPYTLEIAPTPREKFEAAMRDLGGAVARVSFDRARELCGSLDSGGSPESPGRPAKGPAQFLAEERSRFGEDPLAAAAVQVLCPQHQPHLDNALAGNFTRSYLNSFGNGRYLVGDRVGPGTYTTTRPVEECYWERSDAQGNIIDNNFISIAPPITVTIYASDAGFTSQNCGTWQRVG